MLGGMRHSWALASSFGLFGLASLPLACFSDNTTTSPGEPDASEILPDAAGPVEDAEPPSDATTTVIPDAGADAPPIIDAGPLPLTLTVLLNGAPEPGVNVVLQDDTGAVVTTAITGATGSITQLVAAGSQVTVLLGTPQYPNLITIEDVAPGDVLEVVDTASSTSTFPGEELSVSLPAPTWDASGISEQVFAGNCYNPLPYPLYLSDYCTSAGQFPLLAIAANAEIGQELAYTYQLANPEPDGTLPDGATSLPIALTRPWSTSSAIATIDSTNAPSVFDDGENTSLAPDVSLSYFEIAGGVSYSGTQAPGGSSDGGAQTGQFVMHPGYPDFVQGQALASQGTSNGIVVTAAATRAASQATSLTMSFDLSTLPLITAASLDSTDGGTTAQPNVTWTSAGSLAAATGIFASTQWFSSTTTDAGTSYVSGTWTLLAPPTATSMRAPALPASLSAWAPAADASFTSLPRVGAVKASTLPGYAGLRAVFGSLSLIAGYPIVPPTLSTNGTIYVVGIYPDEG
jgi:hypothetical protein